MRRHDRLREQMERRGLAAVVLRSPPNFAWYTAGADTRVDHVVSDGVADLVVEAGGERVLTSTIEAPRMRTEQTPQLEVIEYAWHEDRDRALRELLGDGPIDLRMERHVLSITQFSTPQEYVELFRHKYGPTLAVVKNIGDDAERRAEFDAAYLAFAREADRGEAGAARFDSEYLIVVATRA